MTMHGHAGPLLQGEYALYLLRVWYEYDGDRPVWRASLKPLHEEQRRFLSSLATLLRHLEGCLAPEASRG